LHNFISNLFNRQQDIPILLADSTLEIVSYLAIGLVYAFTAWVKKQKEAKKRSNQNIASQTPIPPKITNAPDGSGGWMEKLEMMVEEAERESISDENDFDAPSLQEDYYDNLPPVLGDQIEIVNSNAEPDLVLRNEKIDDKSDKIINQSPIYHSNIARDITRDINIARQGFVSAIILNPPRSLEDPDKITRY
jgi:hypothetical protein